MAKEKKIITLGLDEKVIQALEKEKNKSKFVNDLLVDYFFKKKETDKNDLKIISDFIQEMKTLNFKADELYKLLLITTELTCIGAQTVKGIKDNNKIDLMIAETEKYISKFNEFKNITKGD
jgi:hypothetical protein